MAYQKRHITVQELLKIADAPYIIARAAYYDGKDDAERQSWVNTYCRLYCGLMAADIHGEGVDRQMILYARDYSEINERGDNISCLDISGFKRELMSMDEVTDYLMMFGHFPPDHELYAVEYLSYADFAAMPVPHGMLRKYPMEYLAAEVLREYGWNGGDGDEPNDEALLEASLRVLADFSEEPLDEEALLDACWKEFKS